MSILHRITGVLMVLAAPLMIHLTDLALDGEQGFAAAQGLIDGWFFTLVMFVLIWAVLHHLLAGIRCLLIDVHIGVEKPLYRQTALATVVAAPILAVLITGGLL
ncbi:MAG: succinate dehydrogenase, cytochrome b556 subunit [Chromatiales bacterium]|nr:succinate dehydrogenase, cytochrome b556 subunit [Chromatiales bacterium]